MTEIGMLAIDLAKDSFQACAIGPDGMVIYNRALSRSRLLERNANGPGQPARAQRLPERRAHAISGIGKDATKTDTFCSNPVDLRQSNFGLGPVVTNIIRNSGAIKPGDIGSPALHIRARVL